MLNINNYTRLFRLMKNFHTLSNLRIVLFDNQYTELLSPTDKHSKFCDLMKRDPEFMHKCNLSNERIFKKCQQSDSAQICSCHAGLTEAVVPIKENNVILGYIMFGQILPIEDAEHLRNEMLKRFNESGSTVIAEAINGVVCLTREQIVAAAEIMESLAAYFLSNRLISLRKDDFGQLLNLYIDEHITESINIGDLCRFFHMSRSCLYQTAHRYFNVSLGQYVMLHRIDVVKELLRNTNDPINDIAEATGFSDYVYFSRVFKKYTGMSAMQYRKSTYK